MNLSGAHAGAIETFLIANLSANTVLLQNIIDQNELMGLEIDHAIERPDTVIDDCEVCTPSHAGDCSEDMVKQIDHCG